MAQFDVLLWPLDSLGTPAGTDVYLRGVWAERPAYRDVWLFPLDTLGNPAGTDVYLRSTRRIAPEAPAGGGGGPTQFLGLRTYYHGAVQDLALIAAGDGITGMGGIPMLRKNGTTYAIYLVETSDPQASPVRLRTTTGIKAIRQKT